MSDKKKPAPAEETAIIKPDAPGALVAYDWGDDEGRGYENQTSSDKSLPWIKLLQALSPEVVNEVPNAKAGCWMNTLSGEIYPRDIGFLYLCVSTKHAFGRWVPRSAGGGFKGHLDPGDQELLAAMKRAQEDKSAYGRYKDVDGNDLVETFYTHGVPCTEDGQPAGFAAIGFKSTMIRAYKGWMTRVDGVYTPGPTLPDGRRGKPRKPPLYAHLTRIGAKKDKNEKGEFWIPDIRAANPLGIMHSLVGPGDDRYDMAKGLLLSMEAGIAKADYAKSGGADEGGDGVM